MINILGVDLFDFARGSHYSFDAKEHRYTKIAKAALAGASVPDYTEFLNALKEKFIDPSSAKELVDISLDLKVRIKDLMNPSNAKAAIAALDSITSAENAIKATYEGSLDKKTPSFLKSDRDFVLAQVRKNPSSIEFASVDLQTDPEILILGLDNNVHNIRYLSYEILSNLTVQATIREVILNYLKGHPIDKTFKVALKSTPDGWFYLEFSDEKDYSEALYQILIPREELAYFTEDPHVAYRLVSQNLLSILSISPKLLENPEFFAAIRQLLLKPPLQKELLKCSPLPPILIPFFKDPSFVLKWAEFDSGILKDLDPSLRSNPDFILKACLVDCSVLKKAHLDVFTDEHFLSEALDLVLKRPGLFIYRLDYIPVQLKTPEVIRLYVSQHPLNLEYAEALQDDPRVVQEACIREPWNFVYASERLKKDIPFIKEMMKINPLVPIWADNTVLEDPDIFNLCKSSIIRDPKFVHKLLQIRPNKDSKIFEDKEIMMQLTYYDPDAFDLVSPILWQNPDFISFACKRRESNYAKVDPDLRKNASYFLFLAESTPAIIQFADPSLFENKEVYESTREILYKSLKDSVSPYHALSFSTPECFRKDPQFIVAWIKAFPSWDERTFFKEICKFDPCIFENKEILNLAIEKLKTFALIECNVTLLPDPFFNDSALVRSVLIVGFLKISPEGNLKKIVEFVFSKKRLSSKAQEIIRSIGDSLSNQLNQNLINFIILSVLPDLSNPIKLTSFLESFDRFDLSPQLATHIALLAPYFSMAKDLIELPETKDDGEALSTVLEKVLLKIADEKAWLKPIRHSNKFFYFMGVVNALSQDNPKKVTLILSQLLTSSIGKALKLILKAQTNRKSPEEIIALLEDRGYLAQATVLKKRIHDLRPSPKALLSEYQKILEAKMYHTEQELRKAKAHGMGEKIADLIGHGEHLKRELSFLTDKMESRKPEESICKELESKTHPEWIDLIKKKKRATGGILTEFVKELHSEQTKDFEIRLSYLKIFLEIQQIHLTLALQDVTESFLSRSPSIDELKVYVEKRALELINFPPESLLALTRGKDFFSEILKDFRSPDALLTYIVKIGALSPPDKVPFLDPLQEFIALLCDGVDEFRDFRYHMSPTLDGIKDPSLISEWATSLPAIPLELAAFSNEAEEGPIQSRILKFLEDKLIKESHVSDLVKRWPLVWDRFHIIPGGARGGAGVSAESDGIEDCLLTFFQEGKTPDHYHRALETLEQLVEKKSEKDPSLKVFLTDIHELNTKRAPTIQKTNSLKIVNTDAPDDLFLVGYETGGCQNVEGAIDTTKCLLGYVLDGKIRMIAIKNTDGTVVARAIFRILIQMKGPDTGAPALFLELSYSFAMDPGYSQAIIAFAIKEAARLKLPLYMKASYVPKDIKSKSSSIQLQSLGNFAPFEYCDSMDRKEGTLGIAEKGHYIISHLAQIA